MSNTGAHYYDELTSQPASPALSIAGEEAESSTPKGEGDLEAGPIREEKAAAQQTSGLSRAFRSLRWNRAPIDEVSEKAEPAQKPPEYTEEARKLVRSFTRVNLEADTKQTRSGTETPALDKHIHDLDYVPAPEQYKPSIFGALLSSKLNSLNDASQNREYYTGHERQHSRARSHDRLSSGTATPNRKIHWYDKPEGSSVTSLLAHSALSTTSTAVPATSRALPRSQTPRPKSWASVDQNDEVVAEVSDIIARRKYLTKLCAALMKFGAPTHRLEEYLAASARSLAIDADFLFIPGAMVCTFIDHSIYANNVEIVRRTAGLDFGRLKDTFDVYKCVIHKKFTAQEAILELENIQNRPDRHSQFFRIILFGLASVFVGPFSFSVRPIDMGPIFVMSCVLGFLQIKVVPRSEQFSNVFEVFACVLIAFISRALGSIKGSDGTYIFCFSGMAQSSIAMILPGFLVLNSALELQSKNVVSGSVRMVYCIVLVLFLGFGQLIGTTIFGLIKRDAVDDVTCSIPEWFAPENNYQLLYTRFIWAPLFACCLAKVYQAKWKQLPVMALIAVAGHQANFWISTQLSSNLQVANAIGAFVIGCLANLYSRLFHGLAAAAMLPAIYCQVPGGLAASGSLVAGIDSANQIFGNSSSISVINNGTQGFVSAQQDPSSVYGGTIFNVGYGMVQVSIGISVGLYLSALVIYPLGKRRSGLFSF